MMSDRCLEPESPPRRGGQGVGPWITVGTEAGPGELAAPRDLWPESVSSKTLLRYGRLEVRARLRLGDAAPHRARTVHLGPDLIERLAVRCEPVYQFRVAAGVAEIGPVVGLLVAEKRHPYAEDYLPAATGPVPAMYSRSGGLYCGFAAGGISADGSSTSGVFFDPRARIWTHARLPVPPVVFRRSFLQRQELIDRLQALPRVCLFNSRRFDKWQLYGMFRNDRVLAGHLPETVQAADRHRVRESCARYGGVVLKPRDLARGRGVLFVEPDGDGYILTCHYAQGEPVRQQLTAAELGSTVEEYLAGRGYLCQRRLYLAEVDGRPFDVRVVMHRSPDGEWGCSAIECRVAGARRLLTNISAGGQALWLADCLRRAFGPGVAAEELELKLTVLGKRVCAVLDATGEHFAELGLDFALDRAGRIWLIESNALPGFHGFRDLDEGLYQALLRAPLAYACHLAGFGMLPEGEVIPAPGPGFAGSEVSRAMTDLNGNPGRVAAYAVRAPHLILGRRRAAGQGRKREPTQ